MSIAKIDAADGKELAPRKVEHKYDSKELALIASTIAKGCTQDELLFFTKVCERTGLDPFSKQIYPIKRWEDGKEVMGIQTGIDGFRLIAERSGNYMGQTKTMWCGEDGVWKDVWLSKDPPSAARVGVFKKGCPEPLYSVALYREYCQVKRDGTPNKMWRTMPVNQLAKCAEALSLRKACPSDLSGVYIAEELDVIDTTATELPAPTPQNPGETVAEDAPKSAPSSGRGDYNLLEATEAKRGTTKGNEWILTKFTTAQGDEFYSMSKKVTQEAKDLLAQGLPVTIMWTKTAKGNKDITSISAFQPDQTVEQ